VIALLYRSAVTGLWSVLPACVAVLWVFGLMGWAGIPLGVATSMFCAITLGIGVDYAIHFVERYQVAQGAGDPRPELRALEESAPAIVIDSVAIALGFGLLALSQVPANERLGLLVGAALLSSCLLTLVGLGALLPAVARRRS
jgi:predicted RND superfamily exporter protein